MCHQLFRCVERRCFPYPEVHQRPIQKETNKKLNMSSADLLRVCGRCINGLYLSSTGDQNLAIQISQGCIPEYVHHCLCEIMWLVYGFMLDNWVIILTNAVMLLMSGFMKHAVGEIQSPITWRLIQLSGPGRCIDRLEPAVAIRN